MHTLLLAAALTVPAPAPASPVEQARLAFHRQMAAWNSGNLEGALSAYLNSSEMTWVSKRGVEKGFAPFAEAMRKTGAKGVYSGEVLHARQLSSKSALIVVRWAITDQGKRLMGGVSTQLWQAGDRGWRIVSSMPAERQAAGRKRRRSGSATQR